MDKIRHIIKKSMLLTIVTDIIVNKAALNFEKEYSILKTFKKEKPNILDIGAHYGQSIKSFLKYKPRANIISFEPNENLAMRLKKKYSNYPNIKIINSAISLRKNIFFYMPIFFKYEFTGLASIDKNFLIQRVNHFFNKKENQYKIIKKKIKTLKIDNLKVKPDLIKIDVEGGELEVIKSSLKILKEYKPLLIIEYNHNNFDTLFDQLKKIQYEAFLFNRKLIKLNKVLLKNIYDKKTSSNVIFINKQRKLISNLF